MATGLGLPGLFLGRAGFRQKPRQAQARASLDNCGYLGTVNYAIRFSVLVTASLPAVGQTPNQFSPAHEPQTVPFAPRDLFLSCDDYETPDTSPVTASRACRAYRSPFPLIHSPSEQDSCFHSFYVHLSAAPNTLRSPSSLWYEPEVNEIAAAFLFLSNE